MTQGLHNGQGQVSVTQEQYKLSRRHTWAYSKGARKSAGETPHIQDLLAMSGMPSPSSVVFISSIFKVLIPVL